MSEWDEFEEVDEQDLFAILTDYQPPPPTTIKLNPNPPPLLRNNLPRSQTTNPTSTTSLNNTGKLVGSNSSNNSKGQTGMGLVRSQSNLNSNERGKGLVGDKSKSNSRINSSDNSKNNMRLESFFNPLNRPPTTTSSHSTDLNNKKKNEAPVVLLSDDDDLGFDDEVEAFLMEQVENLDKVKSDLTSAQTSNNLPSVLPTTTTKTTSGGGSQSLGVDIDLIDLSDFDDEELAALAGCPTEPPPPLPPKNSSLLTKPNQPPNHTKPTPNLNFNNFNTLNQQGRGQVSTTTTTTIATTKSTTDAGLLPFLRRPYRPPEQCYETRHPYRPLDYCPDAITSWIYPTNYSVREYQFNIVQKALHENTLVCLPTGLGKTFIAAVVMFNYFRWFPDLKVIFMAPTKPLVAQQIESCYHVCGITQEESVEMTGALPPSTRAELWKSKRVFYLTPQVVFNDLTEGLVSPSDISCIVIDEAHRAQKSYAYVTVVKGIYDKNPLVRVLALSATPGTSLDKVQSVVVNLNIARIEFRTEDALDLRSYTHGKQVDKVIVPLSSTIQSLATAFKSLIAPYLERLKKKGAFTITDPESVSSYQLIQARDRYRARASARGANAWESGAAEGDFALSISFIKQLELLTRYGITTFQSRLQGWVDESGPNSARYRQQMIMNPQFTELLQRVRTITSDPSYLDEFKSHPKLGHLYAYLKRHFESQEAAIMEGRSQTKVMVFVQFRETVDEILQALGPLSPMVRPMSFIGQGNVKSGKGLKQREQIEVISRFKQGGFNVLVSTSIGEEGLDIGEVDLIICYDSHASPIRMLQRGGRTGRRREGKICILLTQGKEERALNQSKSTHNTVLKGIQSNRIMFFPDNPRMLPEGVIPECVQRKIEIAPYKAVTKPSRSKKSRDFTPSPSESDPDELASLPPPRSAGKRGTKTITASKRKKKPVVDDDDETLDDLPSLTFDAPWRTMNPTKKVSSVKGRTPSGESIADIVSSRVTDLRSKFNAKRQSTSQRTGQATPPPVPSSPPPGNLNSTSSPHSHRPQEPFATTPSLGHDDLSFDFPDPLTDMCHRQTPPPVPKIKYQDIHSRMLLFFSRFESLQHPPPKPTLSPPTSNVDPIQPSKPVQSHSIHPPPIVTIPTPLDKDPHSKVTLPNISQTTTTVSLGSDHSKPRPSLSSFACTTSKSSFKLPPDLTPSHFLDSSRSDFSKLIHDVHLPPDVQVISDESLPHSLNLSSHPTSTSLEVPPVTTNPVGSPILLDSSPPQSELSPRRVVPDVDPDRTESPCVRGGRRPLKRRIIDDSPSVSRTILSLSSDDPDPAPSPTRSPTLRRRPSPSPVLSSSLPLSQSDKRLKLQALASKRRPTHRHYMELEAEESGEDLSSDEPSPNEEEGNANDSFVCGDDEVLPDSDAPPDDDDDASPTLTNKSIDMQAIYRQSIQSQTDPNLGFATRPQQYGLQGARFKYLPAKKSRRRHRHSSPPSGGACNGEGDEEDDSFIVDDAEPVIHSDWTSSEPDPLPVNRQVLEAMCDLPSSDGEDGS